MNKGTAIVGFLLCFVAGMGLMWGVDRGSVGHGAGATAEAFSTETWSDEDAAVPCPPRTRCGARALRR